MWNLKQRKLIFDVGMCTGADTAYYLAKGFRVVAVEANPTLVERARQAFKAKIECGDLIIVNKAIGKSAGTVRFGSHKTNPEWSSTDPDRLARLADDMEAFDVECVTLDSLMAQHGVPYYLKIDIEGADLDAVECLGRMTKKPAYVSAEAHSGTIAQRLYDYGYRRFMLVDQAAKNAIKPRRLGCEGRFVDIRFTDEHSGPFGKEAPGKWVSIDSVLREYNQRVAEGTLTWHDFHAGR